jgi:hypothetical protein
MDIFVACCATELAEVIGRYLCSSGGLMTLDAGHCDMTSVQWEAGLLVYRQRVAGCFE